MSTQNTSTGNQTLTASILQLSQLLSEELPQHFEDAWSADQDVIFLDNLEEAVYLASARVMDIGDLAFEAVTNEDQNISNYNICHIWASDAVSFLILWRNIIFEIQKALLLVSEGQVKMDNYQKLKLESKQVLEDAGQDFIEKLKTHLKRAEGSPAQLLRLSLQSNPWPTYKHQLAQIAPQCEALVSQFKTMWNGSGLYVLVKSNFQDDFDNQRSSIEEFKASIKQITSSLEFSEEVEIKEIVKELSALNEKFLSDRTYQDMQKDLDADLRALPGKARIIIQPNGNKLSYEDINLKERTVSWLDSEILPQLNNFYVIRANIKNQFNLSLSNLKNRITAQNDQGETFEKADLLNALNTFVKRVAKSEQEILSIRQEVDQQLQSFALHKIFKGNFLNLSIASTINQYNQNNKQRFIGIKKWIAKKGIFVKRLQASVEEEERLSIAEKLVRVINARKPNLASSHYTNMFMTKGYIGASFMVGRKMELEHIKTIIHNWNKGYRGAVMITGTRFSGKTLLAEVISQRFFPEKSLSLAAGKKLQLGGRHLDPTMSLGEQLNFVVKYSLQDKLLIYLDDLHEWHNGEFSLLQNLRALTKIIDRYSNKLFFMVCLNNWQKERLNSVLNLDSVFQAEINTDKVTLQELNQTVLIRHSATHTELMEENEDVLVNNKYIYNKLKTIYNDTDGNIGESLMRWSNDIVMYDDDKVRYTYNDFDLPTFLNSNNAVLLKTILFYGSINEYLLRKLFGPPFQDDYKSVLLRMINVGLIVRNLSGNLEVNKIIANDVAALLADNTNFIYLKKNT